MAGRQPVSSNHWQLCTASAHARKWRTMNSNSASFSRSPPVYGLSGWMGGCAWGRRGATHSDPESAAAPCIAPLPGLLAVHNQTQQRAQHSQVHRRPSPYAAPAAPYRRGRRGGASGRAATQGLAGAGHRPTRGHCRPPAPQSCPAAGEAQYKREACRPAMVHSRGGSCTPLPAAPTRARQLSAASQQLLAASQAHPAAVKHRPHPSLTLRS